MAEAYLQRFGGKGFHVESAGFEPRPINPLVVEVMKEDGFDLSSNSSDSAFEYYKEGRLYDYIITVCDESEDKCPLFPGMQKRLHWPFTDPEKLQGSHEEKMTGLRTIRDSIREKVEDWVNVLGREEVRED
jgi:arsenate reductase